MYQPQSDSDRLSISRMKRGPGHLNIVECVETKEKNIFLYLDQSPKKKIIEIL